MATPPASLADWIAEAIGSTIESVGAPLAGASTATIWPIVASGQQLIVKVYDLGIDGVGADDVRRDAAAMRAAAEVGLVAPRLLATDDRGDRLGSPAIIMTRLRGHPRAHGRPEPTAWVDGLADTLIGVASARMPIEPLHQRRPWFALPVAAPLWASDPGPWRAMNEALANPIPTGPSGFIHRDFHQLNVLWDGAAPVGLVDWVNGCIGPIESDLACARMNIAVAEDGVDGFALADRFLGRCRDAGLAWHPLWDLEWLAGVDRLEPILNAAGFGARITLGGVQQVLERAVIRALAAAERWVD
ncbi:MAG: aminoglycoside phosphotransferase family protein [Actinomycetota bacterium]